MSNDRYERIRAALAKGPTPGPWEALSNVVRTHPIQGEMGGFLVAECPASIGRRLEDAAHIAACDPDTIRELLAERDQLAAALEAAREEVERLNRILGRIVEGDGDSTLTIRAGTDAFAAAREYLRPNT